MSAVDNRTCAPLYKHARARINEIEMRDHPSYMYYSGRLYEISLLRGNIAVIRCALMTLIDDLSREFPNSLVPKSGPEAH